MKRSWLQIVCIVVAGLASTTGCGNKTPQTADATGAQATGPAPGQYNPPPSSGSGAPAGDSGGGDEAATESTSPSAAAPSGAPSMGGIGMAGPSAYGSPAPSSPSPGAPSMGGISMAGPGAYGGPSGGPSAGRPSLGTSGAGAGSPYGDGSGAAAGYSGGAPGSMGSSGPGAPGLGMSGAPGMNGYGYPGGNAPNMENGAFNAGNATMPAAAKPAPPKKLTFEERSKIAFQSGNTNRAYDLAYAHSLMSPDSDAMKVASAYRVAPTKSSPALGIQVAVGLSLVKPDGLTDLKPIGTDWQSITGGGGGMGPGSGGMGAPGMDGFGMPGMGGVQGNATTGSKALTDAAGTMASSFIDAFKSEHAEGKWSLYFKDEEYKGRAAAASQSGMGDMGGMAGGFPGYGGAPGGMLGGGMSGGALGIPGAGGVQGGAQGGAQGGSGGSGASGGVVQFRRSGGILPGFDPESGMFGGEGPQDRPGMSGLGTGGPGGAGHGAPSDDSSGTEGQVPGGPGGVGHGAGGPSGMAPGGLVPGGMGLSGGSAGGIAGDSGFGSAPGMGGYGVPPGMGGPAGGMSGQSVGGGVVRPTIDPADVKIEQGIVPLGPCLHYIGSGEPKSLIENAFEKGYDVLVLFEVEVTQNRRNNVVTNTALIRCLIPADTPKNVENIVKSKSLVNRDVAQAKRKNEDDGVDDVIKSVMRRMGEKISLQPIPEKLTPDYVVTKRLPAILSNEKLSKLCKLSEVNFYYQKGFLDEAQRADFYERIAGDLAKDILSEDLEQRESAILELLNS